MVTHWDSDSESDSLPSTPLSTQSSLDEDEVNRRVKPHWPKYQYVIQCRGFRLDTFRDVKDFYYNCSRDRTFSLEDLDNNNSGYFRACGSQDDDALCHDAGLPENLFRGTRIRDNLKIVVKAVNLYSREFDVIRFLSTPPLRYDPMNHCIPVLDLIELPQDGLGFIVMEEWSSQLITDIPCSLGLFLGALRQCIEHTVFMHKNNIAHLDLSLRNLLTDYKSHYACIDFELSQQFSGNCTPRIQGNRGTEIPPELERGELADPYKVDVWALAVLILRACKLTGYCVPELMHLVKLMLHENSHQRPTSSMVLHEFDNIVHTIPEHRLNFKPPDDSLVP